ncbi:MULTISPECIES: hypothetical protein [unclassified Sphingomonas]|uniref:hypothetical protein n=1 Tax=unclassified Sphingomonas TaxID=196159 RepID=UPI0006FF180F|nr:MULTISPECIES: hypothetical protein [unclassified Sphingomonas]KQS45678.1 hypothetical protein ASG20_18775 [Sphingomonas sp. Leaf198]
MPVLAQEYEIVPRLAQLGLRRDLLLDVVGAAVGGRRNATGYHPLSAGGLLSWIEGTGQLRRIFVQRGWEVCRRDNIESIFNPEIGIKVVFQNAERAGDPLLDPLATSKKGAGSARAIELGQYELWPEEQAKKFVEVTASTWVLFVYSDGDDVRAELSFPKAINGEQFDGFHERILLVEKGDWGAPVPIKDDGEPSAEYEVSVTRKA